MKLGRYLLLMTTLIAVTGFLSSGCALNFYKQNKRDQQQIKQLKSQISDLEAEKARFAEVERMLRKQLEDQIANDQISLEMTDRGLVIILSDDVLFDSGKADVKESAKPVLDQVSSIISEKVPDKNIGVSGHTDNVPIKYSGWKSNWELSAGRATNVLHYMIKQGVSPERLSGTGYGEHRPVASNDTAAGRSKNRRVEIVILPEFMEKRADEADDSLK